MKKICIVLCIVMTLMLTGCENTPSLSLDVYEYQDDMKNRYSVSEFYEPRLITSYEEMESNTFSLNGEEERRSKLYDEDFFVENSVYIIPVRSHKEPLFEIREYSYDKGEVNVEINQMNSFFRESHLRWDNLYYLVLEIETKEIEKISYEIIEKDDYYSHILYEGGDYLPLLDQAQMVFSYVEFLEITNDIRYSERTGINESVFEDNFVIIFNTGNSSEEDPIPFDLYYDETRDLIVYQTNTVGCNGSLHLYQTAIILIIEKSEHITADTEFVIEDTVLCNRLF